MNFSKTAVNRPVTTLMVILIAISFGFLSLVNLKVDLLPNMNIPIALVLTTYDSAGSEEIEKLITDPIESVLGTVPGVKNITSQSSNGSSMVMIEFEDNVDIDIGALDIREKVDLIKGALPDAAKDPMVIKMDINSMSAIMISASSNGKSLVELKSLIDNEVVDRLKRQDGIASVDVSGGREKEIRVTLHSEKLRGYGISESTITQLLAAENSNTPTGQIKQGDKNLTVRVKGEFQSISEIENIPINTPSGTIIYIRDIADVNEYYKENSTIAYTNGEPSVNMIIQKQSTANTVNVSHAVLGELDRIAAEMPDVSFKIIMNPADNIEKSIQSVIDSLVQGGILAVIVLYVFLRNFRSTLVVGVSMPVSVISTFALMYFAGITLNMMSLGGLMLGIGMLVDNSIVVLESIYKKLEEGVDRKTAAIEGAREVAMSVTASTLTTVAVFLPISFVGGLVAQIFNELSLTIAFSLFASLAVSLTFVPMASSLLLSPETVGNVHKHNNIFTKVLDGLGHGISGLEKVYKVILSASLAHKKITILIMIAFVVFTGLTIPAIGFDFMPQTDEGSVGININLPKGSRTEDTEAIGWKVVNAISGEKEIQDVSLSVGGGTASMITGGSSDTASVTVKLVSKEERQRSSDEVARSMRESVKGIAGAEISVSASSNSMGSYGGAGIQIDIKGDDINTLSKISNDMVKLISTLPELSEVKTSIEDSSPQTTIKINREKAASYGINSSSVAGILRTAVSGSVATTYKISGNEFDVRVIQDNSKINYVTDIENILIPSSTGVSVPLHEIADIIPEKAPVTISRDNQQKYVSVTASLNNIDLNTASKKIEEKMKDYIMPVNFTWEFAGNSDQMNTAFSGLAAALIIALLVVYMIMAAEFEAFSYPFIVMFSIPIAMTGGIFGLFIMGSSLSITGFLGLIMLGGVVINNAIVLIDYANLLIRERGVDYFQAIKIAGPMRLRPILMSTLTTVLAMIPMMLSTKEGSEMMKGLAIVVVFGLSLSTLVTLIVIPTIYTAYHDSKNNRQKRKEKRKLKKLQHKQIKA